MSSTILPVVSIFMLVVWCFSTSLDYRAYRVQRQILAAHEAERMLMGELRFQQDSLHAILAGRACPWHPDQQRPLAIPTAATWALN